MEKTNKQLIFERMGIKEPINEDETNYPEKAGIGHGLVNNLVFNIDQAIKQIDDMIAKLPHEESNPAEIPLKTDELNNIKKTLALGLERARVFANQ